MHLVEIRPPPPDNNGQSFEAEKYAEVRQHLMERFGGLTAFTRSPAQGTTTESGKPVQDGRGHPTRPNSSTVGPGRYRGFGEEKSIVPKATRIVHTKQAASSRVAQ